MIKNDFCLNNLVIFHDGKNNSNDSKVIKYILCHVLNYKISNFGYIRGISGKNNLFSVKDKSMYNENLNIKHELFKLSWKQKNSVKFANWQNVDVLITRDENGSGYEKILDENKVNFFKKNRILFFTFKLD